jgi:predicted amidohydrolase
MRIALANIRHPATPGESITLAVDAIAQASIAGANIICFPECFVPGYRGLGKVVPPPDTAFLERAWSAIAAAAAKANLAVVLGTEYLDGNDLFATALVINADGTVAGFQDKVQIDPSEEGTYSYGSGRRVFQAGQLTFGVAICHEGWRYPETVRWCGAAHTSYFTRTSTRPNPGATCPRLSPTPRTHSMRKRPCAARRKTPAISQPSTSRAKGRRPPRR